MSELLNLSVYNPASLSDEDFLRSFVARHDVATQLISQLKVVTPSSVAKHHLIVGQRGMGKTSMLRRLALAAMTDEHLAKVLIPLSFREEQYNVHSMHVFWVNCLDALGDWFDHSAQHAKAEQLDRDVAALSSEAGASLALFNKWIENEKRRPLLLLDNIDLILDGLKKEQAVLLEQAHMPGGIIIVGGSATHVESIMDEKSEIASHFQVIKLDRLTKEELIACLRSLALARGEEGAKVLSLLDKDAARIRALHDLTGGNPRTLTLLYMLLELNSEGDVFSDLERLLDQVTVLYKARIEDLSAQSRVVLDAVALAWNPVLASEVAAATFLEVNVVSSQLDRLLKEGVVEKVAVSKTVKSAFQISERFLNIWYLMRHGPRRQRNRLRWLTVFLRSFYTDAQLVERAKSIVSANGEFDTDGVQFVLALSDAIDHEGWRAVLKNHARDEYERYATSLGRTLDEIVDPSDVPRPKTAGEWIRHGNLLREHLKRSKDAESAFLSALVLDSSSYPAWFNLGNVRLEELANPEGAADALRHAIEVKPRDLPSHYWLGQALAETGDIEGAKEMYRACMKIKPNFFLAAIELGALHTEEGNLVEAANSYQLASKLAPKTDTRSLHASAFFAGYLIEEFGRAARLYERCLEVEPDDLVAQTNFAVLSYFREQGALPLHLEEEVISRHPPHGQALIRLLISIRQGDRGAALSHVTAVFQDSESQIFETYRGFVLLLLREVARQKWGDLLLRMLDESGASDWHWPLRAAYEAYLFGNERLLDVNPEVRTAASKILSQLSSPEVYRTAVAAQGATA